MNNKASENVCVFPRKMNFFCKFDEKKWMNMNSQHVNPPPICVIYLKALFNNVAILKNYTYYYEKNPLNVSLGRLKYDNL